MKQAINTPSVLAALVLMALVLAPMSASAQGTLFVEGDNVGIGTPTPINSLHIVRTVAGAGTLLRLENNGPSRATFNNTTAPSSWSFGHENNDRFTISRDGSGTQEFGIDPNGDVFVKGIQVHSSRAVKTDVVPVSGVEILQKVASLPIAEWRYRRDDEEVRHIGPMAEDFHALFPVGGSEGSYISLTDSAGVALAAIQGLYEELREKDMRIAEMEEKLNARDANLAELLARVAALEVRAEGDRR